MVRTHPGRLGADRTAASLSGDEALGVDVFSDALSAPLYWIAANAGLEVRWRFGKGGLPVGQGLNASTCATAT